MNFSQDFQDVMNEMSEDELEILKSATPEDWAKGIAECATDPAFWGMMCDAFLKGMLRGLQ